VSFENPRLLALKVLNSVEKTRAFANISLSNLIDRSELSGVDRALLIQLVYGTLAQRIALDYILAGMLTRKMDSLPLPIRNILRLGAYQICYMDRIPARAAVDESVKLAHKFGHRGTVALVNAVLRRLADNPVPRWPREESDGSVLYLSTRYSHPQFMVRRWLARLGREQTERLLHANNLTPDFCIRVNTLRTTSDDLQQALLAEGFQVRAGRLAEGSLYVSPVPSFEREHFQRGHYIVQGEASIAVGHMVDPKPGERILDLCSAPGGKTTHLAELMGNRGEIMAFDVSAGRLNLVGENARRLGVSIITTYHVPAEEAGHICGSADRVLLDAPCSGLGVIRHKPDIRHNRGEEDILSMARLQERLISKAAELVRPSGRLVYSVCTMEPEETTDIVAGFLQGHPDFGLAAVPVMMAKRELSDGYGYHFWPHLDGVDGFYVAVLERAGK
jgi:16S rRNA (cytosine967-C5)-methyltransferase